MAQPVKLILTSQQLDDITNLVSTDQQSDLTEEQRKEKIQIVKNINHDVANLFSAIYEQVAERPNIVADKEAIVDRKDKLAIWGSGDLDLQMKVTYHKKRGKKK